MKKGILFSLSFFYSTCLLLAQPTSIADLNSIKDSFSKNFEKDFDIISDTIKPGKKETNFWLVTLKPKKEGFFIIRHLYENKGDWGYKYNTREYQINVIPAGTGRFITPMDGTFNIYKEDSIVIPIPIDTNVMHQSFIDTSHYNLTVSNAEDRIKWHKRDISEGFLEAKIKNNVPELSCMGIKRKEIVHRNLNSWTVSYYAFFKAEQEGKFNLIVGEQSIPITILPKSKSFKILCNQSRAYGWEGQGGSYGGEIYPLNNTTIRVGDILIVYYLSFVDYKGKERPIENKLVINKTEFLLPTDGYNHWLN